MKKKTTTFLVKMGYIPLNEGQVNEIILNSSGDREASSTGTSSGNKSFDTAQEGHNPLVVCVIHLEHNTLSMVC